VVATLTNKENIKPRTMHYYCYCWTHGRTGTKDHTSFNCSNKAKGHRNIVTIAYHLSGSNKKCDWLIGAELDNIKYVNKKNLCKHVSNLNPTHINNKAVADSGASGHYFMTSLPEGTKEVAHTPIQVTLPDSSTISSIKTVILPEPKQLPIAVRIANVFLKLTQGALISVG